MPRQIRTLHDLKDMRDQRKSVTVPGSPCWGKPRPAAFIMNLSGEIILRLINNGMFEYVKKGANDG